MTPTLDDPDTPADVLHAPGDIPPRRVLWRPVPGTATGADHLRFVERDPSGRRASPRSDDPTPRRG